MVSFGRLSKSSVSAPLLALGLASSCAMMPNFKEANKDGYSLENGKVDSVFTVNLHLDGVSVPEFKTGYAIRAVGETCAARGYSYYSFGRMTADQVRGYCYKTAQIRALGVTFIQTVATNDKIVVESLNGKAPTQLKVNDVVLEANGKKLSAIYQIKDEVTEAVAVGKSVLGFKVSSSGTEAAVDEPIILFADGVFGPQDLEKIRSDIK